MKTRNNNWNHYIKAHPGNFKQQNTQQKSLETVKIKSQCLGEKNRSSAHSENQAGFSDHLNVSNVGRHVGEECLLGFTRQDYLSDGIRSIPNLSDFIGWAKLIGDRRFHRSLTFCATKGKFQHLELHLGAHCSLRSNVVAVSLSR